MSAEEIQQLFEIGLKYTREYMFAMNDLRKEIIEKNMQEVENHEIENENAYNQLVALGEF